ncbi:hypothetical protein Nepgr_010260 [Nepenthes gracilis]|uniref:Phytocyanin domain-containing protein n=1 Tax=Nepenthes gracilis TaxID=150966 RepID=A0AAD3SC11_NEPGR|nr:hypothetical protein Nepgr_010260 [Nepenthes gracilis]
MDFVEKLVVVLAVMAGGLLPSSLAAVYKVGDAAGWTTIGNVDYKQWSATKTFHLGDIIRFEYSPQFHNVMQVTHAAYRACNASFPIATHTTGNDTIVVTKRGHHFFLCGVPGHCQAGQKVDINVPRASSSISPTPTVSSTPSEHGALTPGPSTINAATPYAPSGILSKVVVAVVLFSCLV